MPYDFTLNIYSQLLKALQQQGFSFQPFVKYIQKPEKTAIILRHDVDRLPNSSLKTAQIEYELGIKGSYYFRVVSGSLNETVIEQIAQQGHEIGYHYEDLSIEAERQKIKVKRQKWGSKEDCERYLASLAIESFKENLEKLRRIVPVKTICMHGSPMSMWDSRLLWKYYDYHDFGIIGEPYFDVNFDEVLYLTDTGRCWDGDSYNIRDKAAGGETKGRSKRSEDPERLKHEGVSGRGESSFAKASEDEENHATCNLQPATFPHFHSTFDIIKAAEEGRLPDKIMMTFHPQRWTDMPIPWVKELIWQNMKNVGKWVLIKMRD